MVIRRPGQPGSASPLQNPWHTFQTVQTCTVTLQAGNAGGWSGPFSLPIDVLPPPPQATAKAAPPVGSAPQVVQFSVQPAPGSVITSYAWDFGDPAGEGPNTSSDPDPQHTYTQLGTFNPTLTIANAGGSTTVMVNAVQTTQAKPMLFVAANEDVNPVEFTITGSGYLANAPVLIAYLVPSQNEQGHNTIQSDSFGAIHGSGQDTAGVCDHQTVLISWTATDGRHDPGSPDCTLYSPVFQLHC
jgi:hypothetical protein